MSTSSSKQGVWIDEATGLQCQVRRGFHGIWCGYVIVPDGHPWHGIHYDAVTPYPDVHGGLTYSDYEEGGAWLIGFDCGHADDCIPGLWPGELRDLDYAKGECSKLAQAVAEAGVSA